MANTNEYRSFQTIVLYLNTITTGNTRSQATPLLSPQTVSNVHKGSMELCLNRQPMKNIFYMRLHKVGSTTLWSILYRHGLKSKLRLPVLAHPKQTTANITEVLIPAYHHGIYQKFNIFGDHAFYQPSVLDIMENPYIQIILFRHPMRVFMSMLKSYEKISRITQREINMYLENQVGSLSKYKNLASKQLNLPVHLKARSNEFRSKVRQVISNFTVVMLADDYILSLVLLRRTLCWPMKDFLHHPLRKSGIDGAMKLHNITMIEKVCRWGPHDCVLYEEMVKVFRNQVKLAGEDLKAEAAVLKSINNKVRMFCLNYLQSTVKLEYLSIKPSDYSEGFDISRSECKLLKAMPDQIRKMYYPKHSRVFLD